MTLGQRFKELQGKDGVECEECPTRHRGQYGKLHRPSSVAQDDMTMERRILSEGQGEPAEVRAGRYRKDLTRYVKER